MNKKFFTLLASALFTLGVFEAQAIPEPTTIPLGDVVTGPLKQGSLNHIGRPNGKYLYVENDSLYFGQAETLAAGLWCVKAETPALSTYPLFTFENKGAERFLSVDLEPYKTGGLTSYRATLNYSDINSWRFSSKYLTGLDTELNYLMSYIDGTDSVAVLSHQDGEVLVNIIPAPAVGATPVVEGTLIKATLFSAAPIVLDAEAFNTLFGSTTSAERKLNYINPTIAKLAPSSFTDAFKAEDTATPGYLNLVNTNGYLRVDTTVYNTVGEPYLKYAYTKSADFATSKTPKTHNFRLVYLPSVDSLIINVEEAYLPSKTQLANGVKFGGSTATTAWETLTSDDAVDVIAEQTGDDKTYLVIQNLTEVQFCLTVGKMPTQLHIGLGFAGCQPAEDSRTTVASDLYTIQNEKGQYLVAPIYTDSISAPLWVTLEKNVDPKYIPAYQWLVVKNREDSEKSTLSIKNREYTAAAFEVADLQLATDKAVALFTGLVKASGFVAVPTEFKKDAYLGYKYVNPDDLLVTSYVLNYLHAFGNDKNTQLGVNSIDKDSILYVGQKATFDLLPISTEPVNYGNYSNKIKDLSQLKRVAYSLSAKDIAASSKFDLVNRFVGVDSEQKYALLDEEAEHGSIFFFKTNNVLDSSKELYYALVDTSYIFTDNKNVKAGVDDNNLHLKLQSQREVRTSAFSIKEDESPLYRRFNREGAVKSESFYSTDKAADKRDTLKFFRVNEPNNFLYEDANSVYSKGLGINFLGQKHKADFDAIKRTIQFIVDTAYVGRPATTTSKKDTPKPQYLIWSTLATYDGETIPVDECGCEPAIITDGYSIGRLLINATDSTEFSKDAEKYIWDNKWERLAFVYAVRSTKNPDILYIVDPVEFKKVSPFTYDALDKSKAIIRKFDLSNNAHKDVVFSFRLYENESETAYADQTQNFLIESETGKLGESSRLYGKQSKDRNSEGVEIAPAVGGWVKIHNGVPVISRGAFAEKKISDAERFNVLVDNSGETPVGNETAPEVSTAVKVVAGAGVITVEHAAGKAVKVSNILGQTLVSTVLTSDKATIAAPKGIVVVAIEGEDAVKAIVK